MTRQMGRFEVADGGTLFLDEIGELPAETQVKLLRVLEEGAFERLGSSKTVTVDVRVIAVTNRDLQAEVAAGQFRQDLFYRLNVFPLTVPPLRERPEDIPLLTWSFVQEFAATMGKEIESIPPQCLSALQEYEWPGNIRELRNVLERAMILSHGRVLEVGALGARPEDTTIAPSASLDEAQRLHILRVLGQTGWRVRGKAGAAEILQLKPTTLEARMKKLGIQRPS
jgi:transcriptional regulator with GAF, ATPase, and Fis domain